MLDKQEFLDHLSYCIIGCRIKEVEPVAELRCCFCDVIIARHAQRFVVEPCKDYGLGRLFACVLCAIEINKVLIQNKRATRMSDNAATVIEEFKSIMDNFKKRIGG